MYIYHISEKPLRLEELQQQKDYAPAGWEEEGFIHACLASQIEPTLNRWFPNHNELSVLKMKEARIVAEVKHEDLYDHGAEFPHIYGAINTDAVTEIINYKRTQDGNFKPNL